MIDALLSKFLFFSFRMLRGISNRLLDKNTVSPRVFSNNMLRKYAPLFRGDVINVSGWDDRDRENDCYKNYFNNCANYYISNAPINDKGINSIKNLQNAVQIDLMDDLSQDMIGKFDVVFNHTTLEHIFDIKKGFDNLCKMSKDTIILVVPVMQNFHIVKSYGDYWRMTPLCVAKMFLVNGFEPLVIDVNDQPFAPIYCFAIGVRDFKKYENKISKNLNYNFGKFSYGTGVNAEYINDLLK